MRKFSSGLLLSNDDGSALTANGTFELIGIQLVVLGAVSKTENDYSQLLGFKPSDG